MSADPPHLNAVQPREKLRKLALDHLRCANEDIDIQRDLRTIGFDEKQRRRTRTSAVDHELARVGCQLDVDDAGDALRVILDVFGGNDLRLADCERDRLAVVRQDGVGAVAVPLREGSARGTEPQCHDDDGRENVPGFHRGSGSA